jgi:hypothetical protein
MRYDMNVKVETRIASCNLNMRYIGLGTKTESRYSERAVEW